MHDDTDPLWSFLTALTPRVRARLRRTARLYTLVHAATSLGWTPQQLAAECCRDHGGAINTSGIVMFRLEHCAGHGPGEPAVAKVHDGCCEGGWIYDETTDPVTVTKCPGKADA